MINEKYFFRQLDRVRVKGRNLNIVVELICREPEVTPELRNEIQSSEIALNYYFQKQWNDAEKAFNELHLAHPHVKLYQLYLDRIKHLKDNPPPANWDGVYVYTEK